MLEIFEWFVIALFVIGWSTAIVYMGGETFRINLYNDICSRNQPGQWR